MSISIESNTQETEKLLRSKPEKFHLTAEAHEGRFTRILKKFSDEGTSASTIASIGKIIRGILSVVEAAVDDIDNSGARGGFGLFGDIVKLASFGKSCYDMKQNSKDKLKISSLAIGATSSGLTIFKILGYFEVISLANFSAKLGTIPVVGTAAAKWLPFGNILSILDIIKAGVDIALSKREIDRLKVKINHDYDKKKLWKSIEGHGYVRTKYANDKIEYMNEKLEKKRENQEILEAIAKEKENNELAAEAKLEGLKKGPQSHFSRLKIKRATKKRNKLTRYHKKAIELHEEAKASTETYEAKIATWQAMRDAPREMNEELVETAKLKIAKWDLKTLIKKKDIRHEKRSIAFNVFLITVLAASIILTGLALTAIPGVGIALAVAFLALPTIGLGMSFYKKYRRKPTYRSVELPTFA